MVKENIINSLMKELEEARSGITFPISHYRYEEAYIIRIDHGSEWTQHGPASVSISPPTLIVNFGRNFTGEQGQPAEIASTIEALKGKGWKENVTKTVGGSSSTIDLIEIPSKDTAEKRRKQTQHVTIRVPMIYLPVCPVSGTTVGVEKTWYGFGSHSIQCLARRDRMLSNATGFVASRGTGKGAHFDVRKPLVHAKPKNLIPAGAERLLDEALVSARNEKKGKKFDEWATVVRPQIVERPSAYTFDQLVSLKTTIEKICDNDPDFYLKGDFFVFLRLPILPKKQQYSHVYRSSLRGESGKRGVYNFWRSPDPLLPLHYFASLHEKRWEGHKW